MESKEKKAVLNKGNYQRSLALSLPTGFRPSVQSKSHPPTEQTQLVTLCKRVLVSPAN